MTCPQCQHENRSGAKFCDSCGGRLSASCVACGSPAREGARFCDQCGHDLTGVAVPPPGASPPAGAAEVAAGLARSVSGYTPRHLAEKILTSRSALEGERKLVTVLFVDCVGFTALSTRLDPEDLHTIMDGFFQRLLDAVHRYEGTVNQFTGDGVMALFGAPIAHEDHAARAVAAALEIQEVLGDYSSALRSQRGLEFSARIGLNTGPVVVGKIGDDLRMDYTAQGETVNLAARLQAAAPPRGVLVSEATHRLVDGYFVTEDQGLLSVKGVDSPVRAFRVKSQRSRRARFDIALERGLTPLVGRARDLALLEECLGMARDGRGHVVSIVGESGVGKSRLSYELRGRADRGRVDILEAQGLPHGGSLPFHLVVQLLERLLAIEDDDSERVRAEKVEAEVRRLGPSLEWALPAVKHLLSLPAELGAEGLDQAQQRRRLIDAARALVLSIADGHSRLLIVEDLQWTDPSSEEFLTALVDSLAVQRALLVCTYRSGYRPPWDDRSFHKRLSLDPLSTDETAEMVSGLTTGMPVAAPLRDFVIQRAEGNPFFIEELMAFLRERGMLSATLQGSESAENQVPQTIQDLLAARIDRLSEPLKRTVQIASVLGREFPLQLLEAVFSSESLSRDLAELVRLEILHERALFPEIRYRFVHLLTQQVAYQGLLLKTRAELHGTAARALERLCIDPLDEQLLAIAEHYARSSDRARAVQHLVRAGDRAVALFAYAEAQVYYRRALASIEADGSSSERRPSVLEKLGDAAYGEGSLGDARQCWVEALSVTEACGDRRRAAELHRKIAAVCWAAGEKEAAISHVESGLAILGDDVENLEAARLYQELGRIHFRLGNQDRATEWAERALELGQRIEAADVISHAYNTLGVALARGGDLERGAESVRLSLETALAHQLGSVACRAYINLAVMYTSLDHRRSADYCREGTVLAEKIGDRLQQSWLYCALASGHCTVAGDYDEGVKAAQAAIALDQELGQRNHLPIPLIIVAQIYQCRGDYELAARYYQEALTVAESIGEPQMLVPCYEGLATIAIEMGDEAGTEVWLAKSRDSQEISGGTSDTFLVVPFLC